MSQMFKKKTHMYRGQSIDIFNFPKALNLHSKQYVNEY